MGKTTENAVKPENIARKAGLPASRRTPIRTCVSCRTSGGKRGLLRVVRRGAGEQAGTAALDPGGKMSGRGAYVCPTVACIELAVKQKKLERSLKTPLTDEVIDALRNAVQDSAKPELSEDSP